tara:strand:+ start:1476 stop:1961 length:486 start_codon:yes stop_codon:yes gene_type:complete
MGEKKVLPIVVCLCVRENNKVEEILLIKREQNPYIGYWALIGGKIEYGEHPEQAAEREVLEETGLNSKCTGIKGVNSEILSGDHELNFLCIMCQLIPLSDKITSDYEGEVRWFPLKALPEKLIPNDHLLIDKYLHQDNITISRSHLHQKEGEVELTRFDHG